MLPGDTAESVEGIPEASLTYRLKATVARGKLAYDLHASKHLRVIRTLEPGALEFLHSISVDNTWANKVDYSISIPQKAAIFGGVMNLEMRFTPLLKGLELGQITAKLMEIQEICFKTSTGVDIMKHRVEREVSQWTFDVSREEYWNDMIEDTGQEGWTMTKALNLPRRLRQCVQDVNHHGIKTRHRIKLTVALNNPDGHVSEVCPQCCQQYISQRLLTFRSCVLHFRYLYIFLPTCHWMSRVTLWIKRQGAQRICEMLLPSPHPGTASTS